MPMPLLTVSTLTTNLRPTSSELCSHLTNREIGTLYTKVQKEDGNENDKDGHCDDNANMLLRSDKKADSQTGSA